VILPGCTRKAVVALAEERQLRVEERPFSIAEALAAKEAFITSASLFVQPATSSSRVGGRSCGHTSQSKCAFKSESPASGITRLTKTRGLLNANPRRDYSAAVFARPL